VEVDMPNYPVRVGARLDEPLSRWLWLVKWLLAIPHYVVLWFLWIAYFVLTVIAFFAILFTGRYPSSIFDFNVGVLRWSWRVAFYSYSALGTDRYPPFTLAEVPDYPATLTIDHPEHLSRGLVLVKWWLLAIPHYAVVGIFLWGANTYTANGTNVSSTPGLVALLVLFAAVALLFTGRYPRGMFDFVVGMNRWALRVAAYASLMTDAYPPFRLDGGAGEPSEPGPVPPDQTATAADQAATATDTGAEPTTAPIPSPPGAPGPVARSHWSAGRVVSVIVGAVLLLGGLGAIAGGGWLAWADQTQRDQAGFLNTPTARVVTADYGLRYDTVGIGNRDWDNDNLDWLGTVRVRATGSTDAALFIGIAQTRDVNTYLGQPVSQRFEPDGWSRGPYYQQGTAQRPPTAPTEQRFWATSASGSGPQSITWEPRDGRWTLVVMNADSNAGVDAELSAGATLPHLRTVWIVLFIVGGIATLVGALLMAFAIQAARRPAGSSGGQ
jgi:uncharacterized protein DUF4389